jgi:AcrR family transcriptional regulator
MTATSPRRKHAPGLASDGSRKAEILDTAAELFSASGLRTSVHEIADACGILPGSLYHHFESKEAIFVELVARYLADLDRLAEKTRIEHSTDARPVPDQVISFGLAIAECVMRHRAALLLTLYEPPAGASRELVRLVNRAPDAIVDVMSAILQRGAADGTIRNDLPLERVADRICDVMLHGPTSRDYKVRWSERAALKCSLLLHGISVDPPNDQRLDRSSASRVVDDVITEWEHEDALEADDKASRIRAVARSEFARRGYELTTIRDVAAAAGVSTGTIYRMVATKDDLLAAIMRLYIERITLGWERILATASTTVEKLDALVWFNINVVDRFTEEHRIQSLAFQFLPPKSPALNWTLPAQLRRQLKALVSEGVRAGELQLEGTSLETGARCAFALIWTPEHIVEQGVRRALDLDRNLLMRGAAARGVD